MNADKDIGANVARLRGGVSQQTLAERMRELGWKWSQATVWAVEKGERPLRLAEAVDLARILEQPLTGLLRDEVQALFEHALATHLRAEKDLEAAILAYDSARRALAHAVLELPHNIHLGAFDRIIQRAPEDFAERMRKDDERLPADKRRMLTRDLAQQYAEEWRSRTDGQ